MDDVGGDCGLGWLHWCGLYGVGVELGRWEMGNGRLDILTILREVGG